MNLPAETNNHLWSHNFNINEQRNLSYMHCNGQLRNQQFNQQMNRHTHNPQHEIRAYDAPPHQQVPKTYLLLKGSVMNNQLQWEAVSRPPAQMRETTRITAPPQGHGYSYSTPVYDQQPRQHVGPTTQEAMYQQRYIQEHMSRGHAPPPTSTATASSDSIQMPPPPYPRTVSSLNTASGSTRPLSYLMSLYANRTNNVQAPHSYSRSGNQTQQPNPQQHMILTGPPTKKVCAPKPPSYNNCHAARNYKKKSAKVPLLNPVTEMIESLQTNASVPQGGLETPLNTPPSNLFGVHGNVSHAVPKTAPIELTTSECYLSSTSGNKVVAVVPPMSPIQPTISEADSPNFDKIQKKKILNFLLDQPDSARPNSNSPPVDESVRTGGFTPTEDLEVPVTPTEESPASEIKDGISNAVSLESLKGTTAWTAEALEKLLQSAHEENTGECPNVLQKIIDVYWDGSLTKFITFLKDFNYAATLHEILTFCSETVEPDTVICRGVDEQKQLERLHVLKEDEVYTEAPYTSSWLNTNESLDDIDKEFGFPPKHHFLPRKDEVTPEPHSSLVEIPGETLQQSDLQPEETQDSSAEENAPIESDTAEVTTDPPDAGRPPMSPEWIEENDPIKSDTAEVTTGPPDAGRPPMSPEWIEENDPIKSDTAEVTTDPPDAGRPPMSPEWIEENNPIKSDTAEVTTDPPDAGRPPMSPEWIEENDPLYALGIEVMSPSAAKAIFEQTISAAPRTPERENQTEDGAPVEANEEPICTEELEIIDLCDDVELVEYKVPKIEQVCCIVKWKQLFQNPGESACTCDCKLPKEEEKAHSEIDNKEFDMTQESSPVLSIDWPDMPEVIDITDSTDVAKEDDCLKPVTPTEELSEPEQMDVTSSSAAKTHSLEELADSQSSNESVAADLGSVDEAVDETSTRGTSPEAAPVPSEHDKPETKHTAQAPAHDEQTTRKRKRTHGDENHPVPHKIKKSKTLELLSRRVQKISKLRNINSEDTNAGETQTAQLVLYGSRRKDKCAEGDCVKRLTLSGCVDLQKPPKVVSVKFHKNKEGKSLKKCRPDIQRTELSPKTSEKHLKKVRFALQKDLPKRNESQKQSLISPFLVSTSSNNRTHGEPKKSQWTNHADFSVSERRFKGAEKRLKRLKKKVAHSSSMKSPDKNIYSPKLLSGQASGSRSSSPAPKHTLKFSVLPESFSFNDGSSVAKDSPKVGHKPEGDKQDKGSSFSRERKVGTGGLENKKPKPPCPPYHPGSLKKKHRHKH